MSANLLQHPGRMYTFTDDLESFLHVLGWMALRYIPATDSYSALHRGKDMVIFDEYYEEEDHCEGGHRKCQVLCGNPYPSDTFRPRTPTPLFDLLRQLSSPFKSLYAVCPPTAEDRKNANSLPDISNKSQFLLYATVVLYDMDIGDLQSSTWFINTMKTALDEKLWPTDDKADENLPIAFSRGTQPQVQNWTNQLPNTPSLWENAEGLSSSLKRAASPIPEPSAKRHRGTPSCA